MCLKENFLKKTCLKDDFPRKTCLKKDILLGMPRVHEIRYWRARKAAHRLQSTDLGRSVQHHHRKVTFPMMMLLVGGMRKESSRKGDDDEHQHRPSAAHRGIVEASALEQKEGEQGIMAHPALGEQEKDDHGIRVRPCFGAEGEGGEGVQRECNQAPQKLIQRTRWSPSKQGPSLAQGQTLG